MTNVGSGDRVRLSVQDWLLGTSLLLGQAAVVGGIGVAMWTRLAVLESKVERQSEDIRDMRAAFKEDGHMMSATATTAKNNTGAN